MLQRLSKLKTALRNKQFINNSFLYLLLAAIVWVAYFHHSAKFGLYYEDYSRIPIAMEWTWSQLWNYLAHLPEWLIAMKYEGRPLHPSFIYFFSRLGEAIAGLQGIYVISYGVTTVNTFLFYSLINRLSAYPFFAFTSALAFALFPTNTNHAFLTSTLGVLPALTLILISFHLHLSKTKSSRITAYFLAFCSLFCYEKFLLVFFTAPLLKPKWDARVRQETIRHSLVLLLFIAIAVVARKLNGEGRVNQLELVALTQPLISLVIGPLATVFTFILRPIQSLISFQQDWVIPSLICFGLIAYTHFQLTTSRIEKNLSSFDNDFSSEEKSFFSKEHFFRDLAHYAIVGSLMLILAYPFTLTDSAFYISGRRSHVHVAAVVGASILCGCACLLVQFILRSRSRPAWLASSVLAAFFTLLIAFGFTVQRDYILSTQYQQGFWTDVSRLCPDMTQDTVILVEDASLARVEHMNPFAGQFARILGFIYKFPEAWIEPDNLRQSSQPKVLRLNSNWQANILIDNNLLRLDRKTLVKTRRNTPKSQLNSTNVIFLQAHQGQLVRKTDSLVIDDKTAQFKQNSSNLKMPPFEKGVLYPYLINDLSNQSINYLSTGSQEEAIDQYEDENSI